MKRALIAATIAALTIPVGLAGPAQAGNDVHVRLDPRDWTWSGTIIKLVCQEQTAYPFTLGPNAGLQEIFTYNIGTGDTCGTSVWIAGNTLTSGDASYQGKTPSIEVTDSWVGDMKADTYSVANDGTALVYYNFGKLGDGYELKFYPSMWAQSLQNVTSATDNTVSPAVQRSKNTGYVTRNPNRVTAMAKRFVAAPNSLINIHGYGPDKDVALARANHIRDHLLAEVTRLGGDPDEYPVMVIYAGDPDHKKGVHVTIHQHAASSITVPEGGALTIGGTS